LTSLTTTTIIIIIIITDLYSAFRSEDTLGAWKIHSKIYMLNSDPVVF